MRILELHAPYFRDRWRRDHEVLCWGRTAAADVRLTAPATDLAQILAALPAGWTPDAIFLGDDCQLLRVFGLEDAPCPVVFFSVDAQHHASWHGLVGSACDEVLLAQLDYIPGYAAAGVDNLHWMPLWAPDDVPAPSPVPVHDLAFVGTLDVRLNAERVAFVDALRPRLPGFHASTGAWREVYARSRMVLNQTVGGDLNFRVFEGLASGALLLTERTGNGLEHLFADGEHLVTYPRGDVDAVVALVERYRHADPERSAIAERGRARVLASHCERHRAAEVLGRMTAPGARPSARQRHTGLARAYCVLAHGAGNIARRTRDSELYPRLRALYLSAATVLAHGRHVEEPDRSAVLGMVAIERGEAVRGLTLLAEAIQHGGRPEDHLVRIETLIRMGDFPSARVAAEFLATSHPGYELGAPLVAALGLIERGDQRTDQT